MCFEKWESGNNSPVRQKNFFGQSLSVSFCIGNFKIIVPMFSIVGNAMENNSENFNRSSFYPSKDINELSSKPSLKVTFKYSYQLFFNYRTRLSSKARGMFLCLSFCH